MALFVPDSALRPGGAQHPLHFVPPTMRERRAQAVHRLQVGLFGLAGMLLIVGLANIIMDRARISDDATTAASAASAAAATATPDGGAASPATDPLADMGVVPGMPAAEPAEGAAVAPGAPPSGR